MRSPFFRVTRRGGRRKSGLRQSVPRPRSAGIRRMQQPWGSGSSSTWEGRGATASTPIGSRSTVSGSGMCQLQAYRFDWWAPSRCPGPIPRVRPARLTREGGILRVSASKWASVQSAMRTTAGFRRAHGGDSACASIRPSQCGPRPPRHAPPPTPATSGPWPGSEAASPRPPTARQSPDCCRGRRA